MECETILDGSPDNSIDAVVADPLYGLGSHEPSPEGTIRYRPEACWMWGETSVEVIGQFLLWLYLGDVRDRGQWLGDLYQGFSVWPAQTDAQPMAWGSTQ